MGTNEASILICHDYGKTITTMENEKWDEINKNGAHEERLKTFLESSNDCYAILQLRKTDDSPATATGMNTVTGMTDTVIETTITAIIRTASSAVSSSVQP